MNLLPALSALAAGALFGLIVHIQQKGLDGTDALVGSFISVAAAAAMFWLLSPLFVDWTWWTTGAALLFALCGIVFPSMGQGLQVASVERIGPALTSAIGSFAPLFAVIPAVVFLHEEFGLQAAAGLALMIAGLVLTVLGPRGIPRGWPAWALLLSLGAAAARGLIQPVTKVGFAEVDSPFFATLVMASVSTVVLGVMVAGQKRPASTPGWKPGYGWFALSGVINGCGILALQFAISRGDVTVAAPFASTTPLWALVFGALFFRHERLGPRHGAVAILVVLGAVLIVTR